MATQEDRSLGSGMSLPKWMKTKMNDKFDFDQSAFSPTGLDDSFMFHYRNNNRGGSEPPQTIAGSTILVDPQKQTLSASASDGKKPDFSKHTLYCQKFLNNPADSASAQVVQYPMATAKTKSSGTDDGFKGEAAKCGSSVIRMAHQMVSGKMIRGFDVETKHEECPDMVAPPEGFNPSRRRGSKSLPSSPLSSPRASRRMNKYFTGPFVDTDSQQQGGWSLTNLLSAQRKPMSQSVGYIAEEQPGHLGDGMSHNASAEDLAEVSRKQKLLLPKPSEFREMNFLSPTSL